MPRSTWPIRVFAPVILAGGIVGTACAAADQPAGPKAAPLSLIQTVELPEIMGGMNHLAVDTKRGRFFVTAPREQKVVVVDLKEGKPLRTLAGPASAALFVSDLDQLCVSGGGAVTFYDGASLTPVGKVDLGGGLDELCYDVREKRLYVGMMDTGKTGIAVIDVPGHKLLAQLKLPAKPQGFVVEAAGTRIYANTPSAEQVTVLDRSTRAVVAGWKLAEAQSNYPIALDEKNHRLFVGCRKPDRLLVLDTASGKTVASVETGGDADDMSFDPAGKRIYLACGDGVITSIQQVDADRYQKLPHTPTAKGARNSLFAAKLKTFYLAVPRQGKTATQLRGYRAND
jgi:DNA-binding beta-propeller fold protein YncE